MPRTPPPEESGSVTRPNLPSFKTDRGSLGTREHGNLSGSFANQSDAFWSGVLSDEADYEYKVVSPEGSERTGGEQRKASATNAARSDEKSAASCGLQHDSFLDHASVDLKEELSSAKHSLGKTIKTWSVEKESTHNPQTVAEAKKSSSRVLGAGPFADGSWGPVPLSTLSSGLQDFVLQTIGNEVLKEVRHKDRTISRDSKTLSGKMSAAKQVAVSFDDVREKNLKQLRKLNQVLFPVRYEEKFYTDVLSSGEFTKLAYYSDICVGAIASKLEKRPDGGLRLYIMTLGVLAPYRRLGIASKLLQHCLDLCKENPEVVEVYLHVQTSRDEAIDFYKKFGFEIVETLENYYKRIEPPHAYVLMKSLQTAADS